MTINVQIQSELRSIGKLDGEVSDSCGKQLLRHSINCLTYQRRQWARQLIPETAFFSS